MYNLIGVHTSHDWLTFASFDPFLMNENNDRQGRLNLLLLNRDLIATNAVILDQGQKNDGMLETKQHCRKRKIP